MINQVLEKLLDTKLVYEGEIMIMFLKEVKYKSYFVRRLSIICDRPTNGPINKRT